MWSLLSWNILHPKLVKANEFDDWPERVQQLLATIADHRPNLLCLQEVDLADTLLEQGLNMQGYEVFLKSPKKQLKCLQRYPDRVHLTQLIALKRDCEVRVQSTEHQSRSMSVELQRGDTRFRLYNVHFEARANEKHLPHLEKIIHHRPAIICGDFNRSLAECKDQEWDELTRRYRNLYDDQQHWPYKTYKKGTQPHNRIIDYVLFDPSQVSFQSMQLIDGSSDHFGIWTEFQTV